MKESEKIGAEYAEWRAPEIEPATKDGGAEKVEGVEELEGEKDESVEDISEKALSMEKGLLEKIRGKAGEIARMLMFVSSLAGGIGVSAEASAEEKRGVKIEQVKIDESKVTGSSKWMREAAESLRRDLSGVNDVESAKNILSLAIKKIDKEYFVPSVGDVRPGPYGLKIRKYSEEDFKVMVSVMEDLKGMIAEMKAKYGDGIIHSNIEKNIFGTVYGAVLRKANPATRAEVQSWGEKLEREDRIMKLAGHPGYDLKFGK